MKVISCYKAAQLAQISKQAMSRQKLDNEKNRGKFPYFCYDRDTGEFGVDIESKPWKEYMRTRRSSDQYDTSKEKPTLIKLGLISVDSNSGDSVNSQAMIQSMKSAFVKTVGGDALLDKFIAQVFADYKGIVNG